MSNTFFVRDKDFFLPQAISESGWGPRRLSGTACAGLAAFALEERLPEGLEPRRLSVSLFRPVPMAPLLPKINIVRQGRRVCLLHLWLETEKEKVLFAELLALRVDAMLNVPDEPFSVPLPQALAEENLWKRLSGEDMDGGKPLLIESRFLEGGSGEGHARAWLRLGAPFVDDVLASPFVRAAALADTSNALGQQYFQGGLGLINADLVLSLWRLPADDWLFFDVRHHVDRGGTGVLSASLADPLGWLGKVALTTIVNPAPWVNPSKEN